MGVPLKNLSKRLTIPGLTIPALGIYPGTSIPHWLRVAHGALILQLFGLISFMGSDIEMHVLKERSEYDVNFPVKLG